MSNYIYGILTGLILVFLGLNILIGNKPLGNCTVTNPDGTEIVYKNCLVNIVVTQEQGNFFKYKRYTFVKGLN